MSHELRFERVFDAAPEEGFDAYTDLERMEEMYGLDVPGWIVESGDLLASGAPGAWRSGHRGGALPLRGDRPAAAGGLPVERGGSGGADFDTEVEVDFEEEGGGTRMTVVQRGFPSAEVRDFHEVGLPHAFDLVERFVRERVSARRPDPP